jgi:hypothetical protein
MNMIGVDVAGTKKKEKKKRKKSNLTGKTDVK